MAPKIAIVIWSLYGHVYKLAEQEKKGAESAGAQADLYILPETLSEDVLNKMHANKPELPIISPQKLAEYDAFLFGIPTRYGGLPGQWAQFFDATGPQWQTGAYYNKCAGVFFSTASPGGGQETTGMTLMTKLVHHGMNFIPLGYAKTFGQLTNWTLHGGSGWGAGTIAGGDGSRMPSDLEMEVARIQGKEFVQRVSKMLQV